MGANHGILLYAESPDPMAGTYPTECFEKNAKYMLVHLENLIDLKNCHPFIRGRVIVEGGLIFYQNLIIGKIVYDLHYYSAPKIIEDIEYKMEICIELFKDDNFSIFYEDCRNIMDSELFVKMVNKKGAEWDSRKNSILKK
jgi:hypothetical protein